MTGSTSPREVLAALVAEALADHCRGDADGFNHDLCLSCYDPAPCLTERLAVALSLLLGTPLEE